METPQIIYWSITAIVLGEFALDITLRLLNRKASHNPIPTILEGLYDSEQYARQQAYFRANSTFSMVSSTISSSATLLLFMSGGFAVIDTWAREVSLNPVMQALVFMFITFMITWLCGLPLSIYDTFSIETRFGFNRTTPRTFCLDTLKGLLQTLVIMGVIIAAIAWIYTLTTQWFWLLAWGAIALFSLFMQYFYSNLIVPLYNKQTPLEEGELRSSIEAFARKVGFPIENIYVIDGSKRSSKANAYFTGFGRKKRIVLYDTLMEQLSVEEITGILAHEIGHYKKGHIWRSTLLSLLLTGVKMYLLGLILSSNETAQAAGCSEASFHVNFIMFSFLYTPLSLLLDIMENALSRHHEWQADEFARENGEGEHEAMGLKKISGQALSNLTPHKWVVRVEYSHPTLSSRISHLTNTFK